MEGQSGFIELCSPGGWEVLAAGMHGSVWSAGRLVESMLRLPCTAADSWELPGA